jgi:hypothetical protein
MPDYGKYNAFMRRGSMGRYRIEIDPSEGTLTWVSGDKTPLHMRAWWASDAQHQELPTVTSFAMVEYYSLGKFYSVGKVLAVRDTGAALAATFEYRHRSLRDQWRPLSARFEEYGLPLVVEPYRAWPFRGPHTINRRHRHAVRGVWYKSFPFFFLTITVLFVAFLIGVAVL